MIPQRHNDAIKKLLWTLPKTNEQQQILKLAAEDKKRIYEKLHESVIQTKEDNGNVVVRGKEWGKMVEYKIDH